MTEKLTSEQITGLFQYLVALPPRQCDIMVVQTLGGTVEVLAEYVWDHWAGEPDSPTQDEVLAVALEWMHDHYPQVKEA